MRYAGLQTAMTATIDEALEILEDTGPEFAGGLANHGPMAAEALLTLGRSDAPADARDAAQLLRRR